MCSNWLTQTIILLVSFPDMPVSYTHLDVYKRQPFLFFARLQCFTPILVILLPSFLLLLPGLPFLTKNHPLLFSLPTANWLLFSCLPCVFLVSPCVLKQRDCSALFPKNFPFFAKKYRDKLCSLLSCQKKFAQSKSNSLLFHAPFFTKSTKSAFAPNGAQQIFVALPN